MGCFFFGASWVDISFKESSEEFTSCKEVFSFFKYDWQKSLCRPIPKKQIFKGHSAHLRAAFCLI